MSLGVEYTSQKGVESRPLPFLIAHSSVKVTEKVLHVTEPVSASLWLPLL